MNAYITAMVAEAIAEKNAISEEQALQWFSMSKKLVAHLHHVAAGSTSPPKSQNQPDSIKPRVPATQPKPSNSLVSSRIAQEAIGQGAARPPPGLCSGGADNPHDGLLPFGIESTGLGIPT